jgi:biopolymer transport protein ExbB
MVSSRRFALLLLGAALAGLAGCEVAAQEAKEIPATKPEAPRAEGKARPQPPAKATRPGAAVGRGSILGLIRDANPMLWPLGICSVTALGFALERLIALRRSRVIPRDFVERFLERLASGKLDRERAAELCRAHESPVARILGHVIRYWGQPAAAIRQALDSDAAGELADLRRNVRVLNGTATLAPLLGLLGTVIGMIESFEALGGSGVGVAKGEALAHGISLALVSTAIGLAIAVVSVTAYYFLLHRIDALVRDLDEQARRVIDLVSAEGNWQLAERRSGAIPGDHLRHESRGVGRTDPV